MRSLCVFMYLQLQNIFVPNLWMYLSAKNRHVWGVCFEVVGRKTGSGEPALPSHDQRVLHWYTHLRIHTHLFVTIFPIITPTIFPIKPPTIIPTIFPITILIIDTQTLTTHPHIYHRIANNNSNHYFLLTNFVSSTLNHEVAVSAWIPNIKCHLYFILKCPGVLWQLFHFFEKNCNRKPG